MASELPDGSYLPEFRVRGLPTTSRPDSSKTTPWRSSPSSAAENTPAINELQRDGVLIRPGSKWKGKGPERDLASAYKVSSGHLDGKAGIIRMSERQYDEVLQKNRHAALQYIDEDDGENIQVGSSLELRQRLAEPYMGSSRMNGSGPLNLQQLHEFDIEPSQDVIEIWSDYEKRSKQKRDELAKSAVGPVTIKPDPPNYLFFNNQLGSSLPTGSQKTAQLSLSSPNYQPSSYENRWASYQSLPGQMNAKPASVPAGTEKETVHGAKNDTNLHEMPSPSSADSKDRPRQPLLSMFEAELEKLMSKPVEAPEAGSTRRAAAQVPVTTSSPAYVEPENTTVTSANASDNTRSPQSDINPGELFANSLKSVLGGVMDLATSVVHHNTDVHRQLSDASKEICKNLDNALKNSGAIDELHDLLLNQGRHRSANGDTLTTTSLGIPINNASSSQSTTSQGKESNEYRQPPIQSASPPASFQAEKIVGRRFICYDNTGGPRFTQYLVRWNGHDECQDVWYDVENLKDCHALVREYETLNPIGVVTAYHDKAYLRRIRDLHNRTAGDRMVTQNAVVENLGSPDTTGGKWPSTAKSKSPTEAPMASDVTAWSCGPFGNGHTRSALSNISQSKTEAQPGTPTRHPPASRNDIPNPPSTRARNQMSTNSNRHLRHRQSWHPTSNTQQESTNAMFNPASVMAKYPTVSEFERNTHSRGNENASASQAVRQQPVSSNSNMESFSTTNKSEESLSKSEKRVSFATSGPSPQGPPPNGLRRAKSLAFGQEASHPTGFSRHDNYSAPSTITASPGTQGPPPRRANTTRERPNAWNEAAPSQMNTRRRSYADISYAEVEKHNKIRNCQRQLRQMGFSEAQSSAVAASVEGNLDEALDILEEDQAAWEGQTSERQRNRAPWANTPWSSFQPLMPGSFFP